MTEKKQLIKNALAPPKEMLPPRGCRGAVSSWTQLHQAKNRIDQNIASSTELKRLYKTPFGGSSELTQELCLQPNLLTGETPPGSIYGQFVWYVVKINLSAKRMRATLNQLIVMDTSCKGIDQKQIGKDVIEVLTGPGGLKQMADDMANLAKKLATKIDHEVGATDKTLFHFRSLANEIHETSQNITKLKSKDLAFFQSITNQELNKIRSNIEELEVAAAKVSIASIMENFSSTLLAIDKSWQKVANGLELIVSESTPEELGKTKYLTKELNSVKAIAEWDSFSKSIDQFIKGLLVAY